MPASAHATAANPPSALLLWAGWVLGPLAWALHETLSYGLVPWICESGSHAVFHVINAGTFAVAALGLLVGWWNRRRATRSRDALGERAYKRARFLASSGMLIAALSLTAIAVESIPTFVLNACAS